MKRALATIGLAILVGVFLAASLPLPATSRSVETPLATGTSDGDPRPPTSAPEPITSPETSTSPERPGLFPPEDLPLLEGPDRVLWQKPDLVMDLLKIGEGSTVADIGAGAGWFTIRLARAVGPNGTVYAQDLQREMVIAIGRRVKRENLRNVIVVQGKEDSLELPQRAFDAILLVDVYPEVKEANRLEFLRNLAASLKPSGRIGIVNYKPLSGGPGPKPEDRVSSTIVEKDAHTAKLHVLSTTDLRYQYMVVIALQG
jgi:protein-L-isoaspartate O-methyltransferase